MRAVSAIFATTLAGLAVSCALPAAPSAGKNCGADKDCGAGLYCQLEVGPHVCLPGPLGVPPPPNHAPVIERALVVVEPGSTSIGKFAARDVDGDAVHFVKIDDDTALGHMKLDEDGSYTFTASAASSTVAAGASEHVQVSALDATNTATTTNALVAIVGPGPGVIEWNGTGNDITSPSSWTPSVAPSAATSVIVRNALLTFGGPSDNLTLEEHVNGWSSDGQASALFRDASQLIVEGTRYLAAAPFDPHPDGPPAVLLAPATADESTVVHFGGELLYAQLSSSAVVDAPVHAFGDFHLAPPRGVGGPAFLVHGLVDAGSLVIVVDGMLVQDEGGAGLRSSGGAVWADGGITLGANTPDAPSSFTASTIFTGGDVHLGERTSGADVTLVMFSVDPAIVEATPTLHDVSAGEVSLFHFLDVHVLPNAGARFTKSAAIGGQLVVAGALAVDRGVEVDVDTLILRPAFLAIDGDAAHGQGTVRAHQCEIAQRVPKPTWVSCDAEIAPPPEPGDAGVVVEPPPNAPPPSRCSMTDETTPDLVTHGLVVAVAGGAPVADKLELNDGTASFVAENVAMRGGSFTLASDGSFTFAPSTFDGSESADLSVATSITELQGCVDVRVTTSDGKDTLIGVSWDDPASWSLGRVPGPGDDVLVPALAGGVAHVAADTGPDLAAHAVFVESGASLDLAGRTLRASASVLAGGAIKNGTVAVSDGATFAGRLPKLSCTGDVAAESGAHLDGITSSTSCTFDAGAHHLVVAGDVDPGAAFSLAMTKARSTLEIGGALIAPELDGSLLAGELDVAGQLEVPSWSVDADVAHRFYLTSDAAVDVGGIDYGGYLNVLFGTGDLKVTNGGHVGELLDTRNIDVTGNAFVIDTLFVTSSFETSTPALLQVGACLGPPSASTSTLCP